MVVGGAETVAHGGEDGHETAEAWVLCKFLFCFEWGFRGEMGQEETDHSVL